MPFHSGGRERYRFRQGARKRKTGAGPAPAVFQHLVYVSAARRGWAFQHLPKGGEGFGGEGFCGDSAHGMAFGLIPATKAAPRAPVQSGNLPVFCAEFAPHRAIWWRALAVVNLAP